jgi:hypothetical protein
MSHEETKEIGKKKQLFLFSARSLFDYSTEFSLVSVLKKFRDKKKMKTIKKSNSNDEIYKFENFLPMIEGANANGNFDAFLGHEGVLAIVKDFLRKILIYRVFI